jgi:prenyltransferase beta subunit
MKLHVAIAFLLAYLPLFFLGTSLCRAEAASRVSSDDVVGGLRRFYEKTARPDGSFQPGTDPDYLGMSDCAFSDLAAVTYACTIHKTFGWRLPHERKTVDFLLSRQKESGEFVNVAGTVDPVSPQGRVYNTTQALVALRALGVKPRHDPLSVFEEILKQDYKTLPAYSTSFFPLAYLCYGKQIPQQADRAIRALMVQDDEGYLNDHVAATFHASHYYALVGDPTPKSQQMVERMLRDQKADGSWMLNLPARDRHATFDAVFTLLHEGHDRADCRMAIERAARWALSCRNADGGFGHFPGSTSDADAVYFQVGTLVMAGFLKPAQPIPDDPHLLSWGHLMPVRQRPPANERIIIPQRGWVAGVALDAQGDKLATGTSDHHARLWDTRSGKLVAEFKAHTDSVASVAFSPDDAALATGSYDHTAKIWNIATREVRHTLTGHRGVVTSVAFSPDGSMLATASVDRSVMLWDPRVGKKRHTLAGHKSWVNSVAFSPDGELLISGSSDGTVKIWSAAGEVLATIEASKAEVRSVAYSPNGKHIAAGIRYGTVKIWQTEGWNERHVVELQGDDVGSLAFTSDGQRLLVATGEWNRPGSVAMVDVATGKKTDELAHTGEVLSVAISRNGKTIAAGGGDNAASVWRGPRIGQ